MSLKRDFMSQIGKGQYSKIKHRHKCYLVFLLQLIQTFIVKLNKNSFIEYLFLHKENGIANQCFKGIAV